MPNKETRIKCFEDKFNSLDASDQTALLLAIIKLAKENPDMPVEDVLIMINKKVILPDG